MALRSIEFTNGEAETTVFGTSPYLILRVEGLGIPGIDTFSQKAPNQDGTTYIDSLLQNRDLVIEIAITKPNAFMDIAAYRRQLSQRLCPKYGIGSLVYTDEAGHQYSLSARASSVVFPNKDYRDPYARAQITFTAHEPYWKDIAAKVGTLPTSETSGESVINNAVSGQPTLIKRKNGSLYLLYKRGSDNDIVSRTYTSGAWGAEVLVVALGANVYEPFPSVAEMSNETLIITYIDTSNRWLWYKKIVNGVLSAPVLLAGETSAAKLRPLVDGTVMCLHDPVVGNPVYQTFDGTAWSTTTTLPFSVGSYYFTFIQRRDLSIFFVYYTTSTNYLAYRTSDDWSVENIIINSYVTATPDIIERDDDSLLLLYQRNSDYYLCYKIFTGSWSPEAVLNARSSNFPTATLDNSSLVVAYTVSGNTSLVSVTRSVTPVPQVVIGDVSAPVKVTFQGPSVNPRIIKQNTLEYIRLNTTLSATDSFIVDTTFGNKTVKLLQGGIEKNGIAFLDIGSTFFQLDRPTLPALPIGVDPWYGLKAHYAMQNIPEIPDDPAGVTYLQDAWATVDGWSGDNATITAPGGGVLKGVSTAIAYNVKKGSIAYPAGTYTIRVRARKIAGVATNNTSRVYIVHNSGATLADTRYIPFTALNEWIVFDTTLTGLVGITTVGITNSGAGIVSGDALELDWFYIGTGAYLPNSLIDSSGNANHGTIFGATPDGEGGLVFDGVNDWCERAYIPLAEHSLFAEIETTGLGSGQNEAGIISNSYGLGISISSTGFIRYFSDNGSALNTLSSAGHATLYDGLNHKVVACYDGTTATIYIDGALRASGVISFANRFSNNLNIGRNINALTTSNLSGTIRSPRIYNRALSAEEVLYLYNNPDTAIPVDADVVYYEDDSVASTAVATLEYTERYAGI